MSRFEEIEVDLTPAELAAWNAKQAARKGLVVAAPVAPVAVEEAPAASPCLPLPAVSVSAFRAYRPLMGERKTRGGDSGQGVTMSPRMHRFYRWCDDYGLGLSDWSTDSCVQRVLGRLEQLLTVERAHLDSLDAGSIERNVQDELVRDIASIMNRVPANRLETVQQAAVEQKKSVRNSLIAVSESSDVTGAVIYWQLTGIVEVAKLAEAFEANGIDADQLPAVASPELALGRAARELASRSMLIRRLKGVGGWAVVTESEVSGKLEHQQIARIFLAGDKDQEVVKFDATAGFENDAQIEYDRVIAEYNKQRAALNVVDISGWLVKLANRMDAVPLRDRGGIYFIPAANVEGFRKVKAALAAISGNIVYEIPAMNSSETVLSIVDAVARDAGAFSDEVEGELNADIGKRAAANRITEVQDMLKKVRRYEDLLGQKFTATVDKLGKLEKRLEKATSRGAQLEID